MELVIRKHRIYMKISIIIIRLCNKRRGNKWNNKWNKRVPNSSGLKDRWGKIKSRPQRSRAGYPDAWIVVMKNGSCCEYSPGEQRRDNCVVILDRLISCDQHRIGLSDMDIEWRISVLEGMRSFYFHKFQWVSLDYEVDGCCEPHIWYSESICLTCTPADWTFKQLCKCNKYMSRFNI